MKFQKRWIKAIIEKGRFKGKYIDLTIGKKPSDVKVLMNKKDISDRVMAVHIHLRAGQLNEVVIELIEF